jgi:hypothetical protein
MSASVIRAARQPTAGLRRVWLTLAALAILMKILVPPGFMAGGPTSFPLVLCTGEAAMAADAAMPPHGEQEHTPDKDVHHAPCVFAGHGLGVPLPSAIQAGGAEFVGFAARPRAFVADLAPGRGLAAPPPFPTGPPIQA